MADPTKYARDYSFTDYQASNPNKPLPGPQVDTELDNVANALDTAVDAIKDIRRSDGALKNGIVTADSVTAEFQTELAVGVLAALADEVDNLVEAALPNWRGPWAATTAYADNDIASEGGSSYICVVAHISAAAFSTDVSAGRWQIMAQQGAPGPGTGDMLRANNLSDLNSAATALSNLGGTTVGRAVFTAANAGAARTAIGATPENSDNRIINGDFGVWQRGTSSTSAGYVAADRWVNGPNGGTVTQSRQAFTVGDTLGTTQPTYFLRQTVSGQTLSVNQASTIQRIEGVRTYAGQTISVLGWARRSSGVVGNMAVDAAQDFGTGGGSTSVTGISPTTVPLGVTWAPFAVVMNIPSVATKTIGTGGNDFFSLHFWTSAGSDYNSRTNSLGLQTIGVDLWGIHIRVGTWTAADAALYRPRDPGTELALCQRYFCKTFYNVRFTASAFGQTEENYIYWPVTMRAAPVTSLDTTGAVNLNTAAVQTPTIYGARAEGVSAGAGDSRLLTAPVTADAEL